MYTLYIDDLRTPVSDYDYITRSYDETIELIKNKGAPMFISFDHDLGEKNNKILKTGMDIAKWIVDSDLKNDISLPNEFHFKVHSQNPVGKKNIESLLVSYLRHKLK
jgi:hypothetical protein